MSPLLKCALVAYLVVFVTVPLFRHLFWGLEQYKLFWLLVFEHLFMVPLSLAAFMTLGKGSSRLLSFSLSSLVTAALLFVLFLAMVNNMSDRGMGILVLLLFPLIDAAIAAVGILAGLAWLIKKIRAT